MPDARRSFYRVTWLLLLIVALLIVLFPLLGHTTRRCRQG